MSKLCQLVLILSMMFSVSAFGQPEDLPANTEPGKCYAKCLIAEEFDMATEQIQTKAAYSRTDIIVPMTTPMTRQVMVKAPGSKLVPVPATYETVTEQVLIKPEGKRMIPVPPTYETVTEQVEVKPASVRIVPVDGSYSPVTDSQVYVGTPNGTSTGKGSGPGSFNPADLDAVGSALATGAVPSSGVTNAGAGGAGAGAGGAGGAGAGAGSASGVAGNAVNYTVGGGGAGSASRSGSSAEQLATVGTIMPYLVQAASVKIERVPMPYETVTETIEVKPASTKWVKRKADRNCLSADPNDCLVWCLVEVPAEFTTVTKQIAQGCADGYTRSGKGGGTSFGNTSSVNNIDECIKITQIPAVYGSRQVVSSAPSYREEVIPAQYKTVTRQVEKTPATVREETIPAEYGTVTKQVVKTPAGYARVAVPAEYKTVTVPQRSGLTLKPGYRWTNSGLVYNPNYNGGGNNGAGGAGNGGAGGGGNNGAGGAGNGGRPGSGGAGGYGSMVAGDTPVDPASADAYSNWDSAGCPAGYSYDTSDNTCKRTIEVPATYATVTKKAVSRKGGFTEWREVLCSGDVTTVVIRQVQDALRAKGYDPGPTDNVIGVRTKAALTKFQRDNGLPVGQLDFQTLKALGVNY